MHRFIILGAFVLAGALMVLSPVPASALTLRYVAVNGVDSATCGTLTAPCRSITAAATALSDASRCGERFR